MQTQVAYFIKIKPSFPFPSFPFPPAPFLMPMARFSSWRLVFLRDFTKITQESIFCQKRSDKSGGLHIICSFSFMSSLFSPLLFSLGF